MHPHLYPRIVKAKRFMDENFDSPLCASMIAGEASFSPFHFLRVFKKIYGQTPHRYLTLKRLDKAKQLLSQTTFAVHEICTSTGFESLASFSTLFKRHTGYSPAGYRSLQQQKRASLAADPMRVVPYCFVAAGA